MSPVATDISTDLERVSIKDKLRSRNTDEILGALTLEEKVSLLSGRSFCDTPGVSRLGIAPIKVSDGPSGA